MLTDSARIHLQTTSDFSNPFTKNCTFSIAETKNAITYLNQCIQPKRKKISRRHDGNWLILEDLSENALKILLGLTLVNQQEDLFNQVTKALGSNIYPFSGDFNSARKSYSRAVRCLFELTLKAMIVCCELKQTRTILDFAALHNYMVTVDEQAVMHALFSTYPGQPFVRNYSIIRLLI
jgi:hypothetical protein